MANQQQEVKKYDPRDATLRFVNRGDDLDPLGDNSSLRAEMSCGHAVTPESLTGWCRSQLDEGQYTFRCPALKEGTYQKCNRVWTYQEVRRVAALTPEEMQDFEEKMARLAGAEYCDFKRCPKCDTLVERKDLSNLCVCCTVCSASEQNTYHFCWQCLKPWMSSGWRSDRCNNKGCVNQDLEILRNCTTIEFLQVEGVTGCPSIRACPTCGQRVEHDKTGCKNIRCKRCQVEFCFVCLKLKRECSKTSTPYRPCSVAVAPRQRSIPIWHRR